VIPREATPVSVLTEREVPDAHSPATVPVNTLAVPASRSASVTSRTMKGAPLATVVPCLAQATTLVVSVESGNLCVASAPKTGTTASKVISATTALKSIASLFLLFTAYPLCFRFVRPRCSGPVFPCSQNRLKGTQCAPDDSSSSVYCSVLARLTRLLGFAGQSGCNLYTTLKTIVKGR